MYKYVSAGAKADGSSPTAGVLKVDTDDAALSQVYIHMYIYICICAYAYICV